MQGSDAAERALRGGGGGRGVGTLRHDAASMQRTKADVREVISQMPSVTLATNCVLASRTRGGERQVPGEGKEGGR